MQEARRADMMSAMRKTQALPLLLGLGLLFCVAEGFVGMHGILPVSQNTVVREATIERLPQPLRRNHLPIASSLHATVESQTSTTSAISSERIHEMAAFLCVSLVQTVMTKAMTGEGESMDLEALERLTAALQGSNKSTSEDDGDKSTSSLSSTPEIDSVESTLSTNVEAPEPKLEESKETEIEPLATENELPEAAPLALDTPEEEESITSDLVDEGWDPYDDHHNDFSARKEEESDIYPEGSVPLPRAETPTYVVSPLEVVESNVVPLRPSSIPQKKTLTVIPEKDDMKVAAVAVEQDDEQGAPLESVAALEEEKTEVLVDATQVSAALRAEELFQRKLMKRRFEMDAQRTSVISTGENAPKVLESSVTVAEEKVDSFLEKETDTVFDASKAWDLGEILATTSTASMQEKGEKLVDATQVSAAMQAEELFRRRLLERRFKMEAMENLDDYSKEDTGSLSDDNIIFPDKRVTKVESNAAGEKRITDVERAAIVASNALQQKTEDLFRRRLLALQFELVAREEAAFKNQEKERQEKKANELFQQRLLAVKFENDSKALKVEKKKNDYLFRRKLLKKTFQYENSRIEKELIDKCRSREKFEFATKAIEIIRQEREEELKSNESFSSEVETSADEIAPSLVVDERSGEESRLTQSMKEEAQDIPSLDTPEAVEKESVETLDEQQIETVQTDIELSDDTIISDETDNDKESGSSRQMNAHDEWVSSLPTVSQERYAKEIQLSRSFQFREYNPTAWSRNNHFQTIVGTLYRKETMYSRGSLEDFGIVLDIMGVEKMNDEARKPLDEFEWDKRFRVETKDGDYYVADWKYAKNRKSGEDENPVCLICHGLESCSDSEIVREIAIACNENGMDAACLNFRGCHDMGASCNLTPRGYHLGFTDDLLQQIEEVHEKNPNRRIYLSGFSLGAGVVTRLLTQLGPKAYEYNVCGAATNAVPFDVMQNYQALNGPGFTRSVYGERLLKSMKVRMAKQYDQGGFTFDKEEIEKCETIMDIENLAICPVFGFDDAYDYYSRVKTIDKLQQICVPQYVIQARDDPFFVGLEELADDDSIPLRIQYTDYGGHCGYILHQREPDEKNCKTSWMPRQLARFLAHIEEERTSVN